MEYSSFFNSENGDRKYQAEDWDRHLKDLIGNGVFKGGTNLQVTADGSGMSVALQPGSAWINGKHYLNDQALTFAIETADGTLNRIDRIVLCLDYGTRTITAQVKKGTFASSAAAPDLQRNADKYELCVANISVPAGTSEISQSLITDTRLDNSVCGIVSGLISQVDTTTFYKQIQNDLAHFKNDSESGFSTWSDAQKTAFETWLQSIKDALNEDTAGNLLSLINAHKSDKSNPHGVTAEQAGAVQGNTKAWIATAVGDPDVNNSCRLTIPNFQYSEGCQITYKTTAPPSANNQYCCVSINDTAYVGNNVWFAIRKPDGSLFNGDEWIVGATITVTLSSVSINHPQGWPTAFFKGGGSYGTLAAQINNFYATIGDASVRLTWSNPPDGNYAGVAIVRKTGGYPSKVLDGTKIYEGTGTSFTDTGLANGTQYFYRAFAYNSKHEYQTEYCVATMTPLHGYQLGTFPIGTKLKFGSIFGNPIVMKIANISGNNVTLITDGIIARYAFDAKEPLNGDSNRQNYGNNRYVQSNIHQWLNSEAAAGAWYAAQHGADQPPDSTNVVYANPYSTAAGFLNGFSTKEKNYLKTQTITVGKSSTDGGGTEALNARVWLPSETEVGLQTDFVEGSQLSAFYDNNSRIAYETADCAAHCGGTAWAAWYYWLRTPYPSNSYGVRMVISGGTLGSGSAYNGYYGVRPLCNLDSSVLLSLTPDASGAYTVL